MQAAETLPELFRPSGNYTWGMGKLYDAKLPEARGPKQWDNKARANGGYPDGTEEVYDHREDPLEFRTVERPARTLGVDLQGE